MRVAGELYFLSASPPTGRRVSVEFDFFGLRPEDVGVETCATVTAVQAEGVTSTVGDNRHNPVAPGDNEGLDPFLPDEIHDGIGFTFSDQIT